MAGNKNISTGEQAVMFLLKKNGYFGVEKDNVGIIADSGMRKIFVSVSENKNVPVSKEIIKKIKEHAESINREGWIAQIELNNLGQLIGDIDWINLAKH